VLERKEAISEKGKGLPIKMEIDDFAEVPLYNLANVHTIMRRMLANTAEGTENSVIVPEGSDVEAVWDQEPRKRGKEPSGIQAGWNYEYLKKILLGDDSVEKVTPAQMKEIDLLVPKFKVNEDGKNVITQGADLLVAWRGGRKRVGRGPKNQLIHAEKVEGESVEGKSLLQRVLSDVFDPGR